MTTAVTMLDHVAAPRETPGILLDLQQYLAPPGQVSTTTLGDAAHAHICFGVADLASAYRDLSADGVEFVSAPVRFDLAWGVVPVVLLKDPDGFIVELMQAPIVSTDTSH